MATTYSNIVCSPIKGATSVTVSSPFGMRTAPLAGMHNGVDINIPKNRIIAFARGVVVSTRNTVKTSQTQDIINNKRTSLYSGNTIYLRHGDGYETRYFHLLEDSLTVKAGDILEKGFDMAMMGTTGYSTGVHLHFEIRKDGVAVDPIPFILGQKVIPPYVEVLPAITRPELPLLKVNVDDLRYREFPSTGAIIGKLTKGFSYIYLGHTSPVGSYSWAQIMVGDRLVYTALNPAWNEIILPAPKEVILPFSAKVEKDGMVLTVDLQPVSK